MSVAAALLPVVIFLGTLVLMDSFKLVPFRAVGAALAAGAASALGAWWMMGTGLPLDAVDPRIANRYISPAIEEILKALPLVALISRGRVGFLVDAAVLGFAVGAGFALVENAVFLRALDGAPGVLWIARGVGTAVLHGATAAIFAMVSKTAADRYPDRRFVVFLPGLAFAVIVHSAFNHVLLPPFVQMLVMLVVLPLLVIWIFDRSERATREWIGAGLDLDIELLQIVQSQQFGRTRMGQYLAELQSRFPGIVVADMYCLLRVELELSVQAKALVMARGAGLDLPHDDDLEAVLVERQDLQKSVGRTGLLALKPLRLTGRRDRWHRHLLDQSRLRTSSTRDSSP